MPTVPPFARLSSQLLPLLALGACVAAPAVERPSTAIVPATRAPESALSGLSARDLLRRFGRPRLDIRDPTAHKLQFSGDRCILDTYLYAPRAGREPVVSYAEARAPDGRAVDANACAELLRRR